MNGDRIHFRKLVFLECCILIQQRTVIVATFQSSSNGINMLKLCRPHETEIGHDRQHLTFYTMFGYRVQSECDEEGKEGEEAERYEIRERKR
jgi:hypothetical protein